MIGTIEDKIATTAIGEAFGRASGAIRAGLDRAARKEREGQAAAREEGFTDDLANNIDALGSALKTRLSETSVQLAKAGSGVHVEFRTHKARQGEENTYGLDLGIRVVIETPAYEAHKALLVQCKRMSGSGRSGTFPKLRHDGEDQASKMLKVTPASFFFLFCAGPVEELWKMMSAGSMFDWWMPPFVDRSEYLDPGVVVLPATRVLAMSEAVRTRGGKFPVAASDCLRGTVPLGHFVASMFGPCFVGDVRTPVLRLATPRTRRPTISGLDAEVPELGRLRARRGFTVRVTKKTAAT